MKNYSSNFGYSDLPVLSFNQYNWLSDSMKIFYDPIFLAKYLIIFCLILMDKRMCRILFIIRIWNESNKIRMYSPY